MECIRKVVGNINEENTGIMFTLPVNQVEGLTNKGDGITKMNILFYLAVILMAGIFVAKILSKFKLPNVTGYLIAGLIIGPSILGIIPKESLNKFSIVSEVALAFIAYSIGSEFNLAHLKR